MRRPVRRTCGVLVAASGVVLLLAVSAHASRRPTADHASGSASPASSPTARRGHGQVSQVVSALPGRPAAGQPTASPVRATAHRGPPVTRCPSARYGVDYDAPGSGKTVALSFDDGPGRSTAAILQILKHAQVTASFFNIGQSETSMPVQVRAEHAAGFALGDHTWNHQDLSRLSPRRQAREIDRERREQAALTGAYPCLLRPPDGDYNPTTLQLAQQRGMRVWYWSVDTEDWKADGADTRHWVHRITTRAEAGTRMRHPVILMHNQTGGNPATVHALPAIIRYYKSRGYTFVNLDQRTGHPSVQAALAGTTADFDAQSGVGQSSSERRWAPDSSSRRQAQADHGS
jgi:peptidoglycan/xylan/chitin deacetylase (PgdA/CDA1 family)